MKKFTVPEYARTFGYNQTYVRHCCNGYLNPRTGRPYRLKRGHFARLEGPGKKQWVIYVAGADERLERHQSPARNSRGGGEDHEISRQLYKRLSMARQAAMSSGMKIKIEIEFDDRGDWHSTQLQSEQGELADVQLDSILKSKELNNRFAAGSLHELLAMVFAMELLERRQAKNAGNKTPGRSLLNDILQRPQVCAHAEFARLKNSCIECFGTLQGKPSQARFCSTSCKSAHADWTNRPICLESPAGAIMRKLGIS